MRKKLLFISYKLLVPSKAPLFWRGVGVRSAYILFFFLIPSTIFSQKISAIVSRDKIRLGEQFDLKLKVEPTSNTPLLIDSWFNIPDTFEHFQVVGRQPIDTIDIASTKSYTQVITLTSFDTGTHSLPAFTVVVGNAKLQTREIPITIIPVDVRMRKDYNDIKDIMEPAPETDYNIWIAVGIVVLLVIILFFIIRWLLGRKKNNVAIISNPLSIDEAMQKLDALESLYQSKQYKLFFSELILICKNFSDYQLQITTYSKTTSEYIKLLKQKLQDKQLLHQYTHLLYWADKVKFAKAIPTTSECKQSLADAKALLANILSSQNKNEANGI
jgi:hypothetical protein